MPAALASLDPRPKLRSFKQTQAIEPLVACGPALEIEHGQHTQVPEPGTVRRDITHAQAQAQAQRA